MSKKIAIIGAGVSGSLLANLLKEKACLTVFEKAQGCGGRLSRLQKSGHSFDKGAQDFSLEDERAMAVIEPALKAGVLSYWCPSFMVVKGIEKKWVEVKKNQFICGNGNINYVIKGWLKGITVNYSTYIKSLKKKGKQWFLETDKANVFGPFDMVVMTQPAEQTLMLAPQFKPALQDITYSSCMMLYLGLLEPIPNKLADVIMSDGTQTRWIIQNHLKPGRSLKESLVLQSKTLPYDTLLSSSKEIAVNMVEEVETILGIKLHISVKEQHIWRYAKCLQTRSEGYIWQADLGLGVIGDGLGRHASSGVESAILSAIEFSNAFTEGSRESAG